MVGLLSSRACSAVAAEMHTLTPHSHIGSPPSRVVPPRCRLGRPASKRKQQHAAAHSHWQAHAQSIEHPPSVQHFPSCVSRRVSCLIRNNKRFLPRRRRRGEHKAHSTQDTAPLYTPGRHRSLLGSASKRYPPTPRAFIPAVALARSPSSLSVVSE